MRGAAGDVAVLEHIARAIHARPLAVPEREHTLHGGFRVERHHLRAPHRRGGQLLIQAGGEADVVGVQVLFGAPHFLIDPAQRRAAIPRNKATGVEAGCLVTRFLRQQQTHQGLGAGEVHAASGLGVFVVQRDLGQLGRKRRKDGGHRAHRGLRLGQGAGFQSPRVTGLKRLGIG